MVADDGILVNALQAVQQRDYTRAQDLLTRLIKEDPHRADYWLWMSAVVDSNKERIFCLKEAFRLDPKSVSAQRGLAMFGIIPPDTKKIVPLRLQIRDWQNELFPQTTLDKLLVAPGWIQSLVVAGGLLMVTLVLLIVIPAFGEVISMFAKRSPQAVGALPAAYNPSALANTAQATPTFPGPTPLWAMLQVTYTPTAMYVNTPHSKGEDYRAGLRALQREEYEKARSYFEKAILQDPDSPDLVYYLGETYRLEGLDSEALAAYKRALQIDPLFAPGYLGRGRAVVGVASDKWKDAKADFKMATDIDPKLVDAYLELADLIMTRQFDGATALGYIQEAVAVAPDSALVYLYRARAYLLLNEPEKALQDARHANELDLTLVEAYRLIGEAALLVKNWQQASAALAAYTLYQPEDYQAWTWLGTAYQAQEEGDLAEQAFSHAVKLNGRRFDARLSRGMLYLEQKKYPQALQDLEIAVNINTRSFEANLGLGKAQLNLGTDGAAYMKLSVAEGLATTDADKAQVYYWRAQSLENLEEYRAALKDWNALLALPENVYPSEWAGKARQQLQMLAMKTPKPPTLIPQRSPTIRLSPTPTLSPSPTLTLTPTATRTQTSSPTHTSTVTRTATLVPTMIPGTQQVGFGDV